MDSIRLACSSSAYSEISLTDAIQRIAYIGYPAIEIHAGHERSRKHRPQELITRQAQAALDDCNISVANISIGENYSNTNKLCNESSRPLDSGIWSDRQYIEHIKQYIRFAKELGSSSVSVSPGRKVAGVDRDMLIPSMIEGLSEITKFGRGLGVEVGITYGPWLILDKVADTEPLLLKCRGLKLSFHAGNSHLACETPCNVAKEYRQRITHIRIADVGRSDRPYLIPGTGEIEWISFFKTLRWIGYQGFVTVDLSSYQDTPDLAARRSLHYLSNIINGLKRPHLNNSA